MQLLHLPFPASFRSFTVLENLIRRTGTSKWQSFSNIRIANAVPGFKLTNQTPRISHQCGWQLLEAQIYSTNSYQHWRAAEYFALGTARHSWRGVNAIIRNWNQRAPIPYKSKGAKVVKFILYVLLQKDQTASKIYPKQKTCPNLDSAHIDTPVRCHPRCQHPWYYQGTKPIPISMSRNLWSVWMKCQRQNSRSHEVATLLYLRQKSDSPSPMADLHKVFFPGHQAPSTSTCGLGEDHCWWTSPFVYGTILEARKLWDSHIPRAVAEIQIPNPFGDVKSASGHHVSKSKSLVMSKAQGESMATKGQCEGMLRSIMFDQPFSGNFWNMHHAVMPFMSSGIMSPIFHCREFLIGSHLKLIQGTGAMLR